MIKPVLIVFAILSSLMTICKSEAASVVYQSGDVIAIESILYEGEYYDVNFFRDSYNNLFKGSFDVNWEKAPTWVTTINDVLNGETPVPEYCIAPISHYSIPFMFVGSDNSSVYAHMGFSYDPGSGLVWGQNATASQILTTTNTCWARIEAVPIPGAVWLLGSGLIGLAGLRRKLRK